MTDKKSNGITSFLYALIYLFMGFGVLALICIPQLFMSFLNNNELLKNIAFGEADCLLVILILYELKNIMRNIMENRIFILKNAAGFSRIGIYTFMIGAAYMINDMISGNFHIIYAFNKDGSLKPDIFVFIMLGCTFLVISQVLKRAVNIKNENDLTI